MHRFSVIACICTAVLLALMLTLAACGTSPSASLADACNDQGGPGLGSSACNAYQAGQVGVAEAFGILEPDGDAGRNAQDDLQADLPPLLQPLSP
jgi:hypothetical protein